MTKQQNLIWDSGSAYDLFVSLWIIHRPDEFGLRPSWAAGVRSRLSIPFRDVLEHSQKFLYVPLPWIYSLPKPKNAMSALNALEALRPEDRLSALTFGTQVDEGTTAYHKLLLSLDGKQRLSANIEAQLIEHYRSSNTPPKTFARAIFDAWSNREAFGNAFLKALNAYVLNFFQEEENRIIPAQVRALENAQALAKEQDLLALLEDLSAGVRMDWIAHRSKIILAPSFWGAPFVFFDILEENAGILLFGARPQGTTLVPGELIPENLLNALKALANPTRLRILHYMQEGPCTPSELAKILRLRPPTVIHHLHILRLAGLVRVTVSPQSERRYALRSEGINASIQHLQDFLPGA
ncbi:MAG: ArsR/SmtB family transcription factor [Anaerolineales bacterium]